MREVRMTFGEHLEELRLRVIVSLLYLAGGVIIAFVFGDTLLGWALRPHEQAYRGAQRDRQVDRLTNGLDDLRALMTTNYSRVTIGGRPIVASEFHWEVLFPAEVTRSRILEQVGGYDAVDGIVSEFSLPAENAARVSEQLKTLLRDRDIGILANVATDFQLAEPATIPERFRVLHARLSGLLSREQEGAMGQIKSAVGWGKKIEPVVETFGEFVQFLELRREEAAKSSATLAELKLWSQDFRLAEGLDDLLSKFEKSVDELTRPEPRPIIVIDYVEHFSAYLKISLLFGLFLSVPLILYEMWKFVGAGLYPHEQKYVVTFMPFSIGLFVCGALFGFFAMIPIGLQFLASWGATEVEMNFTLGNYVGLFLTLTLILGVVFQTPLLMVFVYKIGAVDVSLFRRARRIAIFVGVFLAVILTPPDPFSWGLMAIPMVLLYELGIIVCSMLAPGRQSPEDSAD